MDSRQYSNGQYNHHYSDYLIDNSRKTLRVERSTSKEDIKAAYFREAKLHHPDTG
jgi:DnaJ-class molecular chaperone